MILRGCNSLPTGQKGSVGVFWDGKSGLGKGGKGLVVGNGNFNATA